MQSDRAIDIEVTRGARSLRNGEIMNRDTVAGLLRLIGKEEEIPENCLTSYDEWRKMIINKAQLQNDDDGEAATKAIDAFFETLKDLESNASTSRERIDRLLQRIKRGIYGYFP